jgi:phenylalanyl-tRNA synthetase beta subunit
MKFLKPWLQDYIVETLPEDAVIYDTLNKKAFEVEEVIATPAGSVFDIKVLPNRAHDSLGHHGMAYELCSSLGLTFKKDARVHDREDFLDKHIGAVQVAIDDEKACTRFMSMRLDGVTVGESPAWLKERLEAIGQRSINNIVDITNYVQFSLNKPMHAYDARSIKGTIRARFAKPGESLMTLDDKTLTLDEKTLVIADDEKVLGLAGIKGGKYSGIQGDTTNVILESANFEPVLIRKTAQKYNIKTDASKRFENGIANNLVIEGLHMTANLIQEICTSTKKGPATDIYPTKDSPYYVGISKQELNDILGSSYDDEIIAKTLTQLSLPYEVLTPEEYIRATYPTLIGAGYKNPSSMRVDAPTMFSCSSLVSYLYKGIWMPSLSIDKYIFSKKITKEELRFGDLIFANGGQGLIRFESVEFLRGTKVSEGVDHVALYVGNDEIVHATKAAGLVVKEPLSLFSQKVQIVGYGRITETLDEPRYVVRVPSVRLDIRIKEDLAEEIGRIIGYEKLTPTLPQLSRAGLVHKRMFYENKVRSILFAKGYSEVITYTFGNSGEVELVKGLADDKEKLRTSLGGGLTGALTTGMYNAPLLGQKTIQVFEFGNIFTNNLRPGLLPGSEFANSESADSETRHFALAIDDGMKKSNFTESVDLNLAEIKRSLGVQEMNYETVSVKPYVIEIDFDRLIASLPEPENYEAPQYYLRQSRESADSPPLTYKTVSPYPFITRDIAMWVPDSITWESVRDLCAQVRNPLVARVDLFDTFSKEIEGVKKTSYAFRLVFQSYEKTLTDEEVNQMMEPYYVLFKDKGYEIR